MVQNLEGNLETTCSQSHSKSLTCNLRLIISNGICAVSSKSKHGFPVCFRLVECTYCGRKQHQVCALHMEQIWPNEFVCASCVGSHTIIKRRENKFTAKRKCYCLSVICFSQLTVTLTDHCKAVQTKARVAYVAFLVTVV